MMIDKIREKVNTAELDRLYDARIKADMDFTEAIKNAKKALLDEWNGKTIKQAGRFGREFTVRNVQIRWANDERGGWQVKLCEKDPYAKSTFSYKEKTFYIGEPSCAK